MFAIHSEQTLSKPREQSPCTYVMDLWPADSANFSPWLKYRQALRKSIMSNSFAFGGLNAVVAFKKWEE